MRTRVNALWTGTESPSSSDRWKQRRDTHTHARTHARTHAHTHTTLGFCPLVIASLIYRGLVNWALSGERGVCWGWGEGGVCWGWWVCVYWGCLGSGVGARWGCVCVYWGCLGSGVCVLGVRGMSGERGGGPVRVCVCIGDVWGAGCVCWGWGCVCVLGVREVYWGCLGSGVGVRGVFVLGMSGERGVCWGWGVCVYWGCLGSGVCVGGEGVCVCWGCLGSGVCVLGVRGVCVLGMSGERGVCVGGEGCVCIGDVRGAGCVLGVRVCVCVGGEGGGAVLGMSGERGGGGVEGGGGNWWRL